MTRKGVWGLQSVRDKQLQSLWEQSYTIWAMGQGNKGEMVNNENGDGASRSSPVQVGSGALASGWATVNSGSYGCGFGVRENGDLWVWGANNWGQLGQNKGGTIPQGGIYYSSPVQMSGSNWSIVKCIAVTTLATKTDGTLWSWGQMTLGSLGLNQSWAAGPQTGVKGISSPTQIGTDTTWTDNWDGGGSCFGVIKTDGTLWTWGANTDGKLGLDQPSGPGQRSSPAQVGTQTTWAQFANGGGHNLARKTDGTLWAWGHNGDGGPLGQNSQTQYSSPRQIPGTNWADIAGCAPASSAAIKTDGTLWTWGGNEQASLGHNNKTSYSSPKQVGTGTDWNKVWGGAGDGGHHFFATKTDGTLWNWGRGSYGALDHNTTSGFSSPIQLGTETVYGGLDKNQIGVNDRSCYIMRPLLTPSQL